MNRFFLILIFWISGCVSIERDIYFKDVNTKAEKTMSAARPGEQFRSDPFDVSSQDQASGLEDAYQRQVILSILNYADGSYTWGFVVPIIPVFFLPNMHFSLEKNEPLRVSCEVVPFFSPQYFEKRQHLGTEEQYAHNKEGLELAEKASRQKDKCTSLMITLPEGSKLYPIPFGAGENSPSDTFKFNIMASDLSTLQLSATEIQLESGRKVKMNAGFSAVKEVWTRYYMVPIAP